jgi:hypothetical protein
LRGLDAQFEGEKGNHLCRQLSAFSRQQVVPLKAES